MNAIETILHEEIAFPMSRRPFYPKIHWCALRVQENDLARSWEDQTFRSDESRNELSIHEDCNCQLDL